MSGNTVDEKSVSWALKVFRPLLQALHLQELKEEPLIRHASSFKIFRRYNMANCVIVTKCKKFTNQDALGIFVWQYDAQTDFYALHIILNKELYVTPDKELRIKRKTTGIHEFTHCVAAMMTFSRLKTKALIELLQTKMSKTFHTLKNYELEILLRELTMPYTKEPHTPVVFPDDHFRTGSEDFQGSYEELARNFLLSYELFCEAGFFDNIKQKEFKELYTSGKIEEAVKVIVSVIEPLSEKKALSQHFIVRRLNEEFIERIKKAANPN